MIIQHTMKEDWKIEYEQWWRKGQIQSQGKGCEKFLLEPVRKLIDEHSPQKLFKLMATDNEGKFKEYQFRNLLRGEVSLSRADGFNDPFDTLQMLNKETIYELEIDEGLQARWQQLYLDLLAKPEDNDQYRRKLKVVEDLKDDKDALIEMARQEAPASFVKIMNSVRKETYVSCFTETIEDLVMWSHYANSHKGFALGYDFNLPENDLAKELLYPVIYSDEKIDVTLDVQGVNNLRALQYRDHSVDILLGLKCSLFKAPSWEYEHEWRMVKRELENENAYSSFPLKPSEIYYGCNMTPYTYFGLHDIALRMGLKEYKMMIDPYAPNYEFKHVELHWYDDMLDDLREYMGLSLM